MGRGVFDDFFDNFYEDFSSLQKKTMQGYPVADIFTDKDGNTVLEFALAGFNKNDLHVDVRPEKQSITVSANTENIEDNNRRIARRGFSKTYVNYDNNLDLANALASYKDGLLTIEVPRRPEAQPLSIEIK
jgi:HSP20 family molecular chaperone IbpA|tara:strand:- start:1864 stop:2256 length:393 start_codon:yes stop_codon:yes gene_type:complete